MSSSSSSSSSGGIGVFGVLGIIFVLAKLGGYIDWSWWLVLLPIYGGIGFVVLFLLTFLVLTIVAGRND